MVRYVLICHLRRRKRLPSDGRELAMIRRIAALGGVYSNHLALKAALDDIERRGIEDIFCLGDLGAFGPHPDRVFSYTDSQPSPSTRHRLAKTDACVASENL